MVALLTDGANIDGKGLPWAVHCTFLREDGSGKILVKEDQRRTFGPLKGKGLSIRLGPTAEEIAIGEGIETCLSFMQMTGTPTWAGASIYGIKGIQLPTIVRRVILLADNKGAGDPGPSACRRTNQRLASYGIRARVEYAPQGKDFNDVLKEEIRKSDRSTKTRGANSREHPHRRSDRRSTIDVRQSCRWMKCWSDSCRSGSKALSSTALQGASGRRQWR